MAQILEKEGLKHTTARSQTYEAKGVGPVSVVRWHPRRVRDEDVSMGWRGNDSSLKKHTDELKALKAKGQGLTTFRLFLC
jgi:hypothetical protein